MYHCYEHDIDHSAFDCPKCVAQKRHEETLEALEAQAEARAGAAEAHAEALAEAQHKSANPGDYGCPHCLYTTLKYRASRCPICHGTITSEYWNLVIERERRAAEAEKQREQAAAEQWKRSAPEREAKAKQVADRKRGIARRGMFFKVFFYYLLPIVTFSTFSILKAGGIEPALNTLSVYRSNLLLFCPVINWWFMIVILMISPHPALEIFATWAVAGLSIGYLIGKM